MALNDSNSLLTNINGVSIAEIESRAVPLLDNTQDKERCRVRSSGGFLGLGESFLERLAIDGQKVAALGTTHQHLASQLERLLTEADSERKKAGLGPNALVSVDFSYKYLPTESSRVPTSLSPASILVSHRNFMGAQWSFFRNLDSQHQPTLEDQISWKEDHEISNNAFPSVVLTIAGGVGTGICHYIEKYGFYEGGKANPYRVDPSVLHWILTGILTRDAIEATMAYYVELQKEAKEQLNAQLAELASAPDIDIESRASLDAHARSSYQNELERLSSLISPLEALSNSVT